ncbi:hypothetical protein CFP56_029272, partial [Quercus suber]
MLDANTPGRAASSSSGPSIIISCLRTTNLYGLHLQGVHQEVEVVEHDFFQQNFDTLPHVWKEK